MASAEAIKNKVMNLVEVGLVPEEIMKIMQEDDLEKKRIDEEGEADEVFPDEIKLISQALAFRSAQKSDFVAILKLLNSAYVEEVTLEAPEFFRTGAAVDESDLANLFADAGYQWLLAEAPNGHGIEEDGVLLGVCAYAADGISRRNGEVEGKLGSIRYLGILPRFRGLLVGYRILLKVEQAMWKQGCCRSMLCIPSCRATIIKWARRNGYDKVNSIPYPGSRNCVVKSDVELQLFVKPINEGNKAQSQGDEQRYDDAISTDTDCQPVENDTVATSKGIALPPLWRHINNLSSTSSSRNCDEVVNPTTVVDLHIPDVD